MAFQIVELTLEADDSVIERRVVPFPYPTRQEAVTAIECIVSTFGEAGCPLLTHSGPLAVDSVDAVARPKHC